jgi:uncharacterized small protein (DUF1192 family)
MNSTVPVDDTEETIRRSRALRERLAATMTELDQCIAVLQDEVDYYQQRQAHRGTPS